MATKLLGKEYSVVSPTLGDMKHHGLSDLGNRTATKVQPPAFSIQSATGRCSYQECVAVMSLLLHCWYDSECCEEDCSCCGGLQINKQRERAEQK